MDYPYLTQALTWAQCKEYVRSSRLELLGRSHAQHATYHSFMARVLTEYEGIEDFLLATKFKLPATPSTATGKLVVSTPSETGSEARVLLTQNDFPYHYEPGIRHYVLWKLGGLLNEVEINQAQQSLLQDQSHGAVDACWYINPTHLKSVLQIDHAHILLNVPPSTTTSTPAGSLSSSSSSTLSSATNNAIDAAHLHLLIEPTTEGMVQAANLLSQGRLLAFPTETVYGLGANALDEAAVLSIFTAKGRPLTDPLIVHVTDAAAALALLDMTPAERVVFDALSSQFWPGPLTIIAKAASVIPPAITANTGFVGVRVPSLPLALDLLRRCSLPIAAPSANRFGHVSPTRAAHVLADLGAKGVHVLDGDSGAHNPCSTSSSGAGAVPDSESGATCEHGIESTVAKIDGSARAVAIFRQGVVTSGELAGALCAANIDGWVIKAVSRVVPMDAAKETPTIVASKKQATDGEAQGQEAPGQAITHYAPDVPCFTVAAVRFGCGSGDAASAITTLTLTPYPYPTSDSTTVSQTQAEHTQEHAAVLKDAELNLSALDLASTVVLDFNSQLAELLQPRAYSASGSQTQNSEQEQERERNRYLAGGNGGVLLGYRDLSRFGHARQAARNLFDYLRWAESVPGVRFVLVAKVDTDAVDGRSQRSDIQSQQPLGLGLGLADRMFRACSGQTRILVLDSQA